MADDTTDLPFIELDFSPPPDSDEATRQRFAAMIDRELAREESRNPLEHNRETVSP